MKLRKILIFVALCIWFGSSYGSEGYVFAQNTDAIEKEEPSGCEYIKHSLSDSLIEAKQNENSSIIFIFYLGKKDSVKNVTERRIKNIETYLKAEIPDLKQFVIAEGKRRNGLGKVEIYIKGNLVWQLFFRKNATDCVE